MRDVTQLRVGSLCAGVGGIDLAFERAGCRVVGQVEWDKHCQRVLKRHWPSVKIYSDLKDFHGKRGSADVIIAGTPCPDFSVAGKRAGLDGERGALFFDFARVVGEVEPSWFVWENVAGTLTSGGGRDLGAILATMADLGYGLAYRVLDAKYLGVPQQRRRIVLVGHRGDPLGPAEILALGEGVRGDSPTFSAPRAVITSAFGDGAKECGGEVAGLTVQTRDFATTLTTGGVCDLTADAGQLLVTIPTSATALKRRGGGARGYRVDAEGAAGGQLFITVRKVHNANSETDYESWEQSEIANTLSVFDIGHNKGPCSGLTDVEHAESVGVRRMTPREHERLNGFPDDWTRWDAEGVEIADSHRYRFMGNSVAVPVFEWVAKRLVAYEHGEL